MHDTAALCEDAARLLLDPFGPAAQDAAEFLDWLGCPIPASPGPAERNRALLLRAAARFTRLFSLDCPTAPGLAVFGAEVPLGFAQAAASGTGASLLDAFEGCVGEGVELLSTVETAEDRAAFRPAPAAPEHADWLAALLPAGATPTEWLELLRLDAPGSAWLPAGLLLRRAAPDFPAPWPLSIGCAAGPTREAAAEHALLELIERDAAALWWRGGRRGRPVALEDPASIAATSLLATLRAGQAGRRSWLLDLTTDLGVPVLAALSTNPAGDGFCCGLAARPSRAAAARAAVLEMAQMEMAHAVVLVKQAEPGSRLNAHDEALLARYHGIRAGDCALLHPLGAADPAPDLPEPAMESLIGRLDARGIPVLALDLTRPELGIPVVRMVCPGLEVEPSRILGARLARTLIESGSADGQHGRIALL
ncbi:YcaO-like family protein [Belnapia sp. T6]|uniref:YcaO-like family protein n=1 Tax=Belnapia mucosa TaxID=2804532 RepID=A0ABS1UWR7_9PROT|nr:YcaO-like family protein [Belnapia mucosa]MBL6453917.1 YcaO-like family protein [Belnapia mucosa]